MITANNMLHQVWSQAGHRLPKARQQLRLLKQQLQRRLLPTHRGSAWPAAACAPYPVASMPQAPRPPAIGFGQLSEKACNDPLFHVAPPPPPSPARPGRTLRSIQIIACGDHNTPVVHLRLSGRLSDVCAELDRLVALESAV